MDVNKLMGTILIVTNIVLGLFGATYAIRFYRLNSGRPWLWLKVGWFGVNLLWVGIYTVVFILDVTGNQFENTEAFHQLIVRPAITITLALSAASNISRWVYTRKGGR